MAKEIKKVEEPKPHEPVANDQKLIDYIKNREGVNLPYSVYQDFKETLVYGFSFEDYEDSIFIASQQKTELDDELIDKCVTFLEKVKKIRGFRRKPTAFEAMRDDQTFIYYEEDDEDVYKIKPHKFETKPNSKLDKFEVAEVIFDYYKEIFKSHAVYIPETQSNFLSILTVFSLKEVREIFTYIRRTWNPDVIQNIKISTFTLEAMKNYSQQSKDIVQTNTSKQTKNSIYYNGQIAILYEAMGNQKPTSETQLAYIKLVKLVSESKMALGKLPFSYDRFQRLYNSDGGTSMRYENSIIKGLKDKNIRYTSDILMAILNEY